MRDSLRLWIGLAAASALGSVAMGAFAAHGVDDPWAKDVLKTGAHYQITHALAVFASVWLAERDQRTGALPAALFLSGTTIFSGSLYAMAFGAPRWLGAITPIGGICLMAGWAFLAWSAFRRSDNAL